MTGRGPSTSAIDTGHVRVVTVAQALAEARERLDGYEERYGVPSERLHEAFTDSAGQLQQTGEYLQWLTTWERWCDLSARLAD